MFVTVPGQNAEQHAKGIARLFQRHPPSAIGWIEFVLKLEFGQFCQHIRVQRKAAFVSKKRSEAGCEALLLKPRKLVDGREQPQECWQSLHRIEAVELRQPFLHSLRRPGAKLLPDQFNLPRTHHRVRIDCKCKPQGNSLPRGLRGGDHRCRQRQPQRLGDAHMRRTWIAYELCDTRRRYCAGR